MLETAENAIGPAMGSLSGILASLPWIFLIIVAIAAMIVLPSIHMIGETQVGLISKRFGKKLEGNDPIAFDGEAGYQAELLMPGFRFKLWLLYSVKKKPWVQVPANEIGVVIAQIGGSLPIGAKSGVYKSEFGNFSDPDIFLNNGGQKGVQRPVLMPGTMAPIHPVAFLVITRNQVYGVPISPEMAEHKKLSYANFGLQEEELSLVTIGPKRGSYGENGTNDMIGIVTVLEGPPLPPGAIAGRLGGFDDLEKMEGDGEPTSVLVEAIIANKNEQHNNYQDFQAFMDNGGRIGLQHDPLLNGAFALNPFLISVELVPMLVVEQGEVAVVKAYVGLETDDTSGDEFKFGSLVRPGHRGIWNEPLRTGKYPINPHCYGMEIVPTQIMTLNWAEAVSKAHSLDSELEPIDAKSSEGFKFRVDLQVQIHIPDTEAPYVISAVGSIASLVNEVLQSAVGNHIRDRIQGMPAISFIETRQKVQEDAFEHVERQLKLYRVETPGVYIQDVVLPAELVTVLKEREIAHQNIATFEKQQEAEEMRIAMEQTKGTAEMQEKLAKSQVGIDIESNKAEARKKEAGGEAEYITKIGEAEGAKILAIGMANAESFEAQGNAIGKKETAIVNTLTVLAEHGIKIMPEILVAGGGSSSLDGLAATLMQRFASTGEESPNDIDDLLQKVADSLGVDVKMLMNQVAQLSENEETPEESETANDLKKLLGSVLGVLSECGVSSEDMLESSLSGKLRKLSEANKVMEQDIENLFSKVTDLLPDETDEIAKERISKLKMQALKLLQEEKKEE